MEIKITPSAQTPSFFGRTLYDEEREAMFFNWTASGFTLRFFGDRLEMDATVFADDFPGEAKNLPWLAVLEDGQKVPVRLVQLAEGRNTCLLFSTQQAGEHTLHVLKNTENSKGRVGVHRLILNGELRQYTAPEPRCRIEFIGDSITCGFGNAMTPNASTFTTELENGLGAYPAVTAELLEADYQSICISGIPLCHPSDPAYRFQLPGFPDFSPPSRAMETQYAYTDRNHQESTGIKHDFTPWNFQHFHPDAIVINLGTNDAFRMSVSGGGIQEEHHFQQKYSAFLQMVRRFNGPNPILACTLGPMNYFLYDAIEKAVASYREETGDDRIFCMKFSAIDPWGEEYGGLAHPNLKTHARMGRELAKALHSWLFQEEYHEQSVGR